MIPATQQEPGRGKALALSVLVHLLLGLALFLGVQWKTETAVVEVELWSPTPRPATQLPPPPPRVAPPEPRPEKQSEPKPEPKPESRPTPTKPDIAIKKEEKKPEPKKPEAKPEPKPEPKAEPRKPPEPKKPEAPKDPWKDLLAQEKPLNRNTAATSRTDTLRAMAEAEQKAAGRKSAAANWAGKITDVVRGNMVLPPHIQGNPEAEFEVTLLPTCEVIGVRLKRSSGNPALDAAIERAILKSSPLPRPEDPAVFQRVLNIKYRPFNE